jgi:hypothetical protein
MMNYGDFLEAVINDGIVAAEVDYPDYPDEEKDEEKQITTNLKREGSVAGFEACRGLEPEELRALYLEAEHNNQMAFGDVAEDYWYWHCYACEVEWVCNVVSALLMQLRQEVITAPTARGVLKATEVLSQLSSE